MRKRMHGFAGVASALGPTTANCQGDGTSSPSATLPQHACGSHSARPQVNAPSSSSLIWPLMNACAAVIEALSMDGVVTAEKIADLACTHENVTIMVRGGVGWAVSVARSVGTWICYGVRWTPAEGGTSKRQLDGSSRSSQTRSPGKTTPAHDPLARSPPRSSWTWSASPP